MQGLDVFGPADVFSFANYLAEHRGEASPAYTVHVAARRVGPVSTASGPSIHADRTLSDPDLRPDVLLVAGGLAVEAAAADRVLVAELAGLAARSGEIGSACTGALLLAEAGLLDGRHATTHWALDDLLAHIADHPESDLSVRALADHVAMSERSFQRLFTRGIGVSPGRYVERVRIDAARRLPEQTDAGIAGIARRCGFTTVETFHRAFRRLVGVTPTDYRRRFGTRPATDTASADTGDSAHDGPLTPASGR